jgi:hypothetical protein
MSLATDTRSMGRFAGGTHVTLGDTQLTLLSGAMLVVAPNALP